MMFLQQEHMSGLFKTKLTSFTKDKIKFQVKEGTCWPKISVCQEQEFIEKHLGMQYQL